MIKFSATQHPDFTLVAFAIENGVCEPSDLATLAPPDVDGSKGIIISGRGPVCLHTLDPVYHLTSFSGGFSIVEIFGMLQHQVQAEEDWIETLDTVSFKGDLSFLYQKFRDSVNKNPQAFNVHILNVTYAVAKSSSYSTQEKEDMFETISWVESQESIPGFSWNNLLKHWFVLTN